MKTPYFDLKLKKFLERKNVTKETTVWDPPKELELLGVTISDVVPEQKNKIRGYCNMFFVQPSSTRMCAHEPVQYIPCYIYFVRSDWIRLLLFLLMLRHNADDVIRRRASARNFFHQHESESTWPLFISFLRPAKAADKYFSLPPYFLYTHSQL